MRIAKIIKITYSECLGLIRQKEEKKIKERKQRKQKGSPSLTRGASSILQDL